MKEILQALQRVFSRRYTQEHLNGLEDIPHTSRFRTVHVFQNFLAQFSYGDGRIWVQVHSALQQLHGRNALSAAWQSRSQAMLDREDDLFRFLSECEPEYYFDFVELMFRVSAGQEELGAFSDVTDSLNLALSLDGSPYRVTAAIFEEDDRSNYQGSSALLASSSGAVSYPQVIKVEEDVAHAEAISPALEILGKPHFQAANDEFRKALINYRKGDYAACLTDCGSSLESVLKVICSRKGLHYSENDTASTLIETVVPGLSMEGFFTQPWTLLATLRNRLSSSHGGGTQPRAPERHFAQYGLTSIAAVIVLVVTIADSRP